MEKEKKELEKDLLISGLQGIMGDDIDGCISSLEDARACGFSEDAIDEVYDVLLKLI